MIKNCVLKIESKKFPILDGEKDEIINENMYGKALCLYLEKKLPSVGVNVPFYCNEDWGWWLEVEENEWSMALCIYSDPDAKDQPESYAIMPSIMQEKKWSWSKFKKIDVSKNVLSIMDKVESLLSNDGEITRATRHDDFPF